MNLQLCPGASEVKVRNLGSNIIWRPYEWQYHYYITKLDKIAFLVSYIYFLYICFLIYTFYKKETSTDISLYMCVHSTSPALMWSIHIKVLIQNYLYRIMDISIMWHYALVSCTPLQSIGLGFGCTLFWCWVLLCAPFIISLIEFFFIMIFIMIVVTVNGNSMVILFILNHMFRFSTTN